MVRLITAQAHRGVWHPSGHPAWHQGQHNVGPDLHSSSCERTYCPTVLASPCRAISSATAFDDTKIWGHSGIEPDTETAAERVRAELTDLVVVALNMAEDLGFDVVAAAVEKSGADIQLGER